jgi:hypothetical protein
MRLEAISKDVQHLVILRQHIGDEAGDSPPLRTSGQQLDEERPKTAPVQVVGYLDRDFRALLVELDVDRVTDERAGFFMGDQTVVSLVYRGREVGGVGDVRPSGKEP